MGRVAWRLSKSWPLRKAYALLTQTRSTVTQGRSTTIAFWGNYGNVFPKLVSWCASARAWPSEVSWWPWGDWGCMGSSSSLAGMDLFWIFFLTFWFTVESNPHGCQENCSEPRRLQDDAFSSWCSDHQGNQEELDHIPVALNKNVL